MTKFKVACIALLIPFIIIIPLGYLKIKHHEEFEQKKILAQQIRKVLGYLMFDLREARESTILDVPADGLWHSRFAFESRQLGPLAYIIKDGHLYRSNKGANILIADHIADLRIRRQRETPYLVEVQIEAQNNVSLTSNLRIRIRQ